MPPPGAISASRTTRSTAAIQAAEVRQMLEAKSYRRQRGGEAPLDVEAEVSAPARPGRRPAPAPGQDAELREEVRQLVVARNERRMRKGRSRSTSRPRSSASSTDFVGSQ